VIHLERFPEYGDTWCELAGTGFDATNDLTAVTCRPCLLSVIDYAEDARHRLSELPGADVEAPPCGCRAGAHPPRDNYLRAEAEREGAVCKLGWLL